MISIPKKENRGGKKNSAALAHISEDICANCLRYNYGYGFVP
jgi:hypothetical protein